MQTKKKSFQIYFDNIPWLMLLPDEQLGKMMKLLFGYAEAVAEEPELTVEEVCETLPEGMEDSTKMAFRFTAASVYRDTQKWWQTTSARLRREERQRNTECGDISRSDASDFLYEQKVTKNSPGGRPPGYPRF